MKKKGNAYRRPKTKRINSAPKDIRRQVNHSIYRAEERHEIQLTVVDILRMTNIVKRGQAIQLKKMSNTRSVKLIERYETCKGVVIKNVAVIYDRVRSTVATILPQDAKEVKNYLKQFEEIHID